MKLLKELCSIRATSGNESPLRDCLIDYVQKEQKNWKHKPQLLFDGELQDSLLLVFGKPRTAIFAHMDSIGFTVRYGNELVKIGGPKTEEGFELVGSDSKGEISCKLHINNKKELTYKFKRDIDRGTALTFKPNFRETKNFIQCCYMDNRLGIWSALQVAKTLKNGIIAFSCYEEHSGGSAENIGRYIFEKYKVRQALISDITWVTEGVKAGKGVAISMRDSGIPRKKYTDRIVAIAQQSGIPYQIEVESAGGSDGNALQRSPYPFDWCFIGAPEQFVHSPNEKVHKSDIKSMVSMYNLLMEEL